MFSSRGASAHEVLCSDSILRVGVSSARWLLALANRTCGSRFAEFRVAAVASWFPLKLCSAHSSRVIDKDTDSLENESCCCGVILEMSFQYRFWVARIPLLGQNKADKVAASMCAMLDRIKLARMLHFAVDSLA